MVLAIFKSAFLLIFELEINNFKIELLIISSLFYKAAKEEGHGDTYALLIKKV